MEKFTEIFKKFKTVDIIIVAGVILDKQLLNKLKRLLKFHFKYLLEV